MSFYGGGNEFYYRYNYFSTYVEPIALNVAALNNVNTAPKHNDSNAVIGLQQQEKRRHGPCIVTLANANSQASANVNKQSSATLNIQPLQNTAQIYMQYNANIYMPKNTIPNYQSNSNLSMPPNTILNYQSNVNQNHQIEKHDQKYCNELVEPAEEDSEQPELDIIVNNVVATVNVRCHLNLRHIALNGSNVEYIRDKQVVMMKFRNPKVTAKIYSSGKVICTGAMSNEDAKIGARKVARILQNLGFKVRFTDYKVVTVLCTCYMYFGINLIKFAQKHKRLTSYEPELHPGATYKIKELRATLKLFHTGSITITAPSTENAQRAVEHIFPLVYEFKTPKPIAKKSQCYNGQKVKSVYLDDYSSSYNDLTGLLY